MDHKKEIGMKKKITDIIISPRDKNTIEISNVLRSGITKTSRTYVVEYLDKGQFNRVFIPLETVYIIEEFCSGSEEKKESKASLKDVVDDGNDDTVVTDVDTDDDYEDLVEDDENENDDDDEDRDAEDDTDDEDDEDGKEYDEEIEKIRKKRANK